MASLEHVQILKEGIDKWNDWREEHPETKPNLFRADLSQLDLNGADLRKADLSEACVSESDLSQADLRGANLIWSDLSWADLSWADLTEADVTGADLLGVIIRGTNLTGVDLKRSKIGSTIFAAVDLRRAKGLDDVQHDAPSFVTIETVYESKGEIPESFLRGAGVPENFITFMKSLTASAFEFYSAFISYSSKDQGFADRIYSDLKAKNVRCYLATEDLKIGDPFRQRIDESIRLHDKLLLILSEHSVQSPWVQNEVEAALERERLENRLVLFPIRIDDAVMEKTAAWAASIRRTRHIGDFTRWKVYDAYQKAFDRLLRDLKDEAKAKNKEAER